MQSSSIIFAHSHTFSCRLEEFLRTYGFDFLRLQLWHRRKEHKLALVPRLSAPQLHTPDSKPYLQSTPEQISAALFIPQTLYQCQRGRNPKSCQYSDSVRQVV